MSTRVLAAQFFSKISWDSASTWVSFPQNSVASLQPPPRKVKDLSLEERCPRVKIMTLDEALAQRSPILFPMFRCFPLDDASAIISICGMGSPQLLAAIDGWGRFISLLMYQTGITLSGASCHDDCGIVPDAITVQSTKSSEHTGTNLTSDVELVYRVTTAGCQRQVQDRWNEAFADFQQKNKAQIWAWKASNDYVHAQAFFRVQSVQLCGVPWCSPSAIFCASGAQP